MSPVAAFTSPANRSTTFSHGCKMVSESLTPVPQQTVGYADCWCELWSTDMSRDRGHYWAHCMLFADSMTYDYGLIPSCKARIITDYDYCGFGALLDADTIPHASILLCEPSPRSPHHCPTMPSLSHRTALRSSPFHRRPCTSNISPPNRLDHLVMTPPDVVPAFKASFPVVPLSRASFLVLDSRLASIRSTLYQFAMIFFLYLQGSKYSCFPLRSPLSLFPFIFGLDCF